MLTIHINRKCNLECTYCYEKDKRDINFSIEQLNDFINEYEKEIIQTDTIELIGGEPMLYYKGIVYCIETIKKINPSVEFIISSNGTVYSKEYVKLFNDNNVILYISCDGTRFMHNACRHFKNSKKGSFDIVKNNIDLYCNELNNKPRVCMTLNHYNIGYVYEGIKLLSETGISQINFSIIHELLTDEYNDILAKQYVKIMNDNSLSHMIINKINYRRYIYKSIPLKSDKTMVIEDHKFIDLEDENNKLKKEYKKQVFYNEAYLKAIKIKEGM